jgi:hypothetical protein
VIAVAGRCERRVYWSSKYCSNDADGGPLACLGSHRGCTSQWLNGVWFRTVISYLDLYNLENTLCRTMVLVYFKIG